MKRRDFLRATGGSGGAVALGSGVAAGQEGTGTATGTEGGGGGGTTHTVDMTDSLVFDPAELTIEAGDTVVWENVGSVGHSVTAYEDNIPEEADFFASGGFDAEQPARDAYPEQGDIPGGESYQHTFETLGTYEYFCIPHESVGMIGTIEVVEEIEEAAGGGERELHSIGAPIHPHWVGAATILMMFVSLVFTFYVLKYGESPNTGNTGGGD
ncbi:MULTISPECIES: plastocyanin/azurin family copper-binding protein [Halolamina]|uniref:Plastocyanin n=1 Tax=Halolamina pelagica TaxID=699431 RepID=A0A1I5R6T1_9EURY|nr:MULTISPECIES: plastocyanin/azurin family copper-binding protein [Halolamina]NHX35713.1 halocyanin [Halolamina sp. R1-12]SFP54219.1 Plastocyanin [Halolamina pelagica]